MATLVLGTDKSSKVSSIIKKVPIPMPPAVYKAIDEDGKLINGSTIVIDLQGATDVGDNVLYYSYYRNNNIIGPVDLSSLTTISGKSGCSCMFESCTGLTSVDLSSLTTVSNYDGCSYMFRDCTGITSIDLSSLTDVSGLYGCSCMFYNCTGLTNVDLSSLTRIGNASNGCQQMFYNCTGLTSVDLSSLTDVSGQSGCSCMFQGCTGLTSIDLSSLTTVTGQYGCQNMFYNCTGLTSVDLSSLTTVSGSGGCNNMFSGCTSLTSLSFPSLNSSSFGTYKNQFQNLVSGITGCTIHFPSNLNPQIGCTTISSLTNYPFFGGTGTILSYDLPPTEIVYTISITAPSGSTIIINGEETDSTIVLPGKTVTYSVTLPGYLPYIRTIDSVETDIDIVLTESDFDAAITTLDVNYDNIDEQLTTTLANVIVNDQFEKNDSLMALTSGNSSYHVRSGTSYGYITYTPTNDAVLSVDGFVSSENNWDFGAVYVGTQIYQPNSTQIKNKTTDGNGEYLFTGTGLNTIPQKYSMNLTPGITYYINLIYAKDSSGDYGEDRIIINQIQILEKA